MSSSGDLAEDDQKKGLMLFGRDVSKIPCFRNSFLYGIGGGFAGGLLTFLVTSRPQFSTHSAMGVFMCVTFGYWTQCRYNWSKTKFEYGQVRRGMQEHTMYEGTQLEQKIKEESKSV